MYSYRTTNSLSDFSYIPTLHLHRRECIHSGRGDMRDENVHNGHPLSKRRATVTPRWKMKDSLWKQIVDRFQFGIMPEQ